MIAKLTQTELLSWLESRFQVPVRFLSAPGGSKRKTVICQIGPDTFAVSQRASPGRALLEAKVLRHLGPKGCSPKLTLQDASIVVQEYVVGPRLSEALDKVDDAGPLMMTAAQSLLELQQCAARAGLGDRVPPIGVRSGWDQDLADTPNRLARALGLTAPTYDFGDLLTVARDQPRVFVKWDARPGNAIIRNNGAICWIDWEHAGARRAVDDLVWLFADEWAPDATEAEAIAVALLARRTGLAEAHLAQTFHATAVAHSAMRLLLIYSRKGAGPWWNHATCLARDRIGVTAGHVSRVTMRASRWSKMVPGLKHLSEFFENVTSLQS